MSVKREELLTEEIVQQIQAHAIEEYPNECAGLIMTDGSYRRVKNEAYDPTTAVYFPKGEVFPLLMEGKIAAFVHSHPNGPNFPSRADMDSQQETDVPWVIVSTNGEACLAPFAFGDQLERPPLTDRGFQHGVTDCYAFIRDWYLEKRGIVLPEFSRSWEWWGKEQLYLDGFSRAGFKPIALDELQEGDGILFAVRSNTPNHAAVYVGNNLIAHHAASRQGWDMSRLPQVEPIGRWFPYATHFLRYQG